MQSLAHLKYVVQNIDQAQTDLNIGYSMASRNSSRLHDRSTSSCTSHTPRVDFANAVGEEGDDRCCVLGATAVSSPEPWVGYVPVLIIHRAGFSVSP